MAMKTGSFSELVTWLLMTNAGVVINNNGTVQKSFTFEGKDTMTMDELEVDAYIKDVNNALKRMKTGYMLFFESQKVKDTNYPEITDENPLQHEFDEARKERLKKNAYEIKSYLTIVYKLPMEAYRNVADMVDMDNKSLGKKLKQMFKDMVNTMNPKVSMETVEKAAMAYGESLTRTEEDFLDEVDQLVGLLSRIFSDLRPLTHQETLTYLHSTISDSWHPVKSDIRSFIVQQLSDSTFVSGRKPKLGKYHLGILGIKDFPASMRPDIMEQLRSYRSEYRFCIRYIALGREKAKSEALDIQGKRVQSSKSMLVMAIEAVTNKDSGKVNEAALMEADEAGEANILVERDKAGLGYLTMNIVLMNEDPDVLAEEMKELRNAVQAQGFICVIERDNAAKAWLSTIPSCYEYNVRRYLVHSGNVAACAPISAAWSGQKKNKHLGGPPLLKARTTEGLPFYLSLHVEDVGHTFIAGATGAGKSVLLNTISAHFQKYPNARVYIFDKSASSRVLTEAMGGNFYNILVDTESIAFQPLANIDQELEQKFISTWLAAYAESQRITIDQKDINILISALKTVGTQPPRNRTLTVLSTAVQSEKWRLVLANLLLNEDNAFGNVGVYGSLFDNDQDKFGTGRWQTFEMDKVMQDESIVSLTLDYLFHRIEGSLNGDPTLIVLDECWLFLKNPAFRAKVIDYIRTLRKANASIIMATQNLADITDELLPIVTNNMETKIYLANRTMNERSRRMYEAFGLNDKEIDIIASLEPKQQYFYKSPLGARVFDLALLNQTADPNERQTIESIFVTATSIADQNAAIKLRKESSSKEEFIQKWKAYKLPNQAV